jgi:hypothetical protein
MFKSKHQNLGRRLFVLQGCGHLFFRFGTDFLSLGALQPFKMQLPTRDKRLTSVTSVRQRHGDLLDMLRARDFCPINLKLAESGPQMQSRSFLASSPATIRRRQRSVLSAQCAAESHHDALQ